MAIDPSLPDGLAEDAAPQDWHISHQQHIAAYNAWAAQRLSFSATVQEWRKQSQDQGELPS